MPSARIFHASPKTDPGRCGINRASAAARDEFAAMMLRVQDLRWRSRAVTLTFRNSVVWAGPRLPGRLGYPGAWSSRFTQPSGCFGGPGKLSDSVPSCPKKVRNFIVDGKSSAIARVELTLSELIAIHRRAQPKGRWDIWQVSGRVTETLN